MLIPFCVILLNCQIEMMGRRLAEIVHMVHITLGQLLGLVSWYLISYIQDKLLHLIWRSNTCTYPLRVADIQMSCKDLTAAS